MTEKKLQSYIRRAEVVAENSPDAETKVGSVLISRSTGSVVSEGYNGFVRGADDERLPKTRPAKYDYVIHAEENLICNAARNGVRTSDCFIVQTHSPCPQCARRLYQSGIEEVYFKHFYPGTAQIEILGDLKLEFTKLGLFTKITMKPNLEHKNETREEHDSHA